MRVTTNTSNKIKKINHIDDLGIDCHTGDILIGDDGNHYIVCEMNTDIVGIPRYVLFDVEECVVITTTHDIVFPLIKTSSGYDIVLEQE
jgi:hypothetical protein